MKICNQCHTEKELSEFNKLVKSKDGHKSFCRSCQKEEYIRNKDHLLQQKKEYYQNNKTTILNDSKQYYNKNKDTIIERSHNYYHSNKKIISEKSKSYRQENKELIRNRKILAYNKKKTERLTKELEYRNSLITVEYPPDYKICSKCRTLKHETEYNLNKGKKIKNPIRKTICKICQAEDSRLYKIEHREELKRKDREKYAANIDFYRNKKRTQRKTQEYKDSLKVPEKRLLRNMSQYIRLSLKEASSNKNNKSTMKYLGCARNFFYEYIERQFIDGMSWNNYGNKFGQWSLDHYIPKEAFDLLNPIEQDICFGWKNCRPIWHKENETKQDEMPDGRKARNTKSEYSLQDKINLIEKRFLSLNLDLNIKQKSPDIFINKNTWSSFTPDQMTKFEENVFNYYKSKGFPYFELDKLERNEIFNKLVNFNSSDILQENNILSQNMLGLNLATYYMPHLWETRSGNFMTPMEVFNNDEKFKLAIKKRIKIGDNISDAGIRKILSMYSGAHKVSNFRPTIAKYIYDNYSGAGNVLDFSSGFGGRLFGALSSHKIINYHGFEPSKKTAACLFDIIKDFKLGKSNISTLPFEDSNLLLNDFDLAFSSPPYFNVEKYSDEPTQSYIRYKTKEEWCEKFLKVLIEKCHNYLKSGGYFIINIANVKTYPTLEQDTVDLAKNIGFILEKTYKMQLSALMKKDFKYEPIFVFKKI